MKTTYHGDIEVRDFGGHVDIHKNMKVDPSRPDSLWTFADVGLIWQRTTMGVNPYWKARFNDTRTRTLVDMEFQKKDDALAWLLTLVRML
jgi:hypothetical protein